jgi:hypothetical protein
MTSSTVQPSPFASSRASTRPGPPWVARRVDASSKVTAIFAKIQIPARLYNSYHERGWTMMTANVERGITFYSLLAATTRSPEIPESADVYGWLCGDWDLEVLHYRGINVAARGRKDARFRTSGSCRDARSATLM